MRPQLVLAVATAAAIPTAVGGPVAYGLCQTACNAGAVTCYAAAGAVFGTVAIATAPVGVPAAIVTCNTILGTCMAACVASLLMPTP